MFIVAYALWRPGHPAALGRTERSLGSHIVSGMARGAAPPDTASRVLAVLPADVEGASPPDGLTEFFGFRFGPGAIPVQDDHVFPLHIEPLVPGPRDETWYTTGQVDGGIIAGVQVVESAHYLAAHMQTDLTPDQDIDEVARESYRRLLTVARRRGYPHLLRIWNLFPDINAGEGDKEYYRQFSIGRGLALDALGYQEIQLPAGTAIGTDPGTPLTITLLAGKEPSRPVENPRQTSAYCYPRQFGPRSPSFSRGVLLKLCDRHELLISGTASIVGHESRHDSVRQQIGETFRNIRALITQAEIICSSQQVGRRNACFRVYLRHREDLAAAQQALASYLQPREHVVFLRGDICRRELALEIEGVCVL
ncbi:pteridine-dependent deoxygenase [soil metagenome]